MQIGPQFELTLGTVMGATDDVSATAARLFFILWERHSAGGAFEMQQTEMAKLAGVSVKQVGRLISELSDFGVLKSKRNGPKPLQYQIMSTPCDSPFMSNQTVSDNPNTSGLELPETSDQPPGHRTGSSPHTPHLELIYISPSSSSISAPAREEVPESAGHDAAAADFLKKTGMDDDRADAIAAKYPVLTAAWIAELQRRSRPPKNVPGWLIAMIQTGKMPAPRLASLPTHPIALHNQSAAAPPPGPVTPRRTAAEIIAEVPAERRLILDAQLNAWWAESAQKLLHRLGAETRDRIREAHLLELIESSDAEIAAYTAAMATAPPAVAERAEVAV